MSNQSPDKSEPEQDAAADEPRVPRGGVSQWTLIWGEFRRRRLAVAGGVLIVFLFTVSVFAPFLANAAPLAYFGYNRAEFQEAVRTLRGALRNLSRELGGPQNAQQDNNSSDKLAELAAAQVELMAAVLDDEKAAEVRQFGNKISATLAAGDADTAAQLRQLSISVRRDFDARTGNFTRRWHFPAIEALIWLEITFMFFNALLLSIPIWQIPVKAVVSRSQRRKWVLVILCGVPLICGAIWKLTVPERIDRTDYKAGQLADADPADLASASVVFEKVVWAPIPFSLDEDDLGNSNSTPTAEHWLGTDGIGRDVMCRMIWGGRVSLAVGVVAVSIYVTIGIIVGAVAGFFRGAADLIISRIIEVVICFPSFFLILTIVAFLGPSIFNIMVVIGLIGWTGVARLVRGEFLRLGEQEFVQAGKALGYSPVRLIFRHVLPNAMAPVLVSATFGIAGAILTESALSFLGFGITVPKPSWGGILASGRESIIRAPWLIYFPGLAIFLTITSYNLVGEALRDAADPRLRGSR